MTCSICGKESPSDICISCKFRISKEETIKKEILETIKEIPKEIPKEISEEELKDERSKWAPGGKLQEKKYCQSCIERYGKANVLATREWTENYFICEDCYRPLIANILGRPQVISTEDSFPIITNGVMPVLKQVYEVLGIPEHLQFTKSDQIIKKREDFFNLHATANVNRTIEESARMIEEYEIILFNINIAIQERQLFVSNALHKLRQEKGLTQKGESYSKGPSSKVKTSQDEKMAKMLGLSVEEYKEKIQKASRELEFKKIVEGK